MIAMLAETSQSTTRCGVWFLQTSRLWDTGVQLPTTRANSTRPKLVRPYETHAIVVVCAHKALKRARGPQALAADAPAGANRGVATADYCELGLPAPAIAPRERMHDEMKEALAQR